MSHHPWTKEKIAVGTRQVTLTSFRDFQSLITEEFNDTRRYVWRGQQCDNWQLESSLARRIREKKKFNTVGVVTAQLDRFKKAARGRRGANPAHLSDNEWWALGQHFGLATPLLDWTLSPYVALYFAFAEPDHKAQTDHRVVFSLHRPEIKRRTTTLAKGTPGADNGITFFEPDSDENSRVLSQRGLFTISPVRRTIDAWVVENFKNPTSDILIKILVPNDDRKDCLRMMNRMNINHLTLFPDLIGAAAFSNVHMDVPNYYRNGRYPTDRTLAADCGDRD